MQKEKSEISFERGTAFSERGQPAREAYCLRSGSAKVTLTDPQSGNESIVKMVGPGDMLGYRCIFSEKNYRGTASALTKSVACKISKDFMLSLIERRADFSFELLRRMGNEVASAEHHHHSFCQKNVRERLAEALLILRDKFGEDTPDGCKINTKLTRAELSNWIGTSRESVIRCLSDFIAESLIREIDHIIYITDLDGLRSLGGFRP